MKKFLMISGIVFWVIILIVAVFFLWGIHLDATSKAFVDKNVPVIVSTWSEQELLKLASPEFKSAYLKEDQSKLWTGFAKLGALKKYEGSKGQSYQNVYFPIRPKHRNEYRHKNGYAVTAEYVADVDFQNGSVKITVDLTRENGDWKIYYFSVN